MTDYAQSDPTRPEMAGNDSPPAPRRIPVVTWHGHPVTWAALAKRLWSRDVQYVYRAPAAVTERLLPGVKITLATYESVQDLGWLGIPDHERACARFLDRGELGYLAYLDGECVHQSWLAIGPTATWPHWSHSAEIGAHQGYVYFSETAPHARGRGIFAAVLKRIVADHPDLSLTMEVSHDNLASQRSARKAGWTHVETVAYSVTVGLRRRRSATMPGGREG